MTIPAPSTTTFVHPDPAKIVVPRKHGQILIEPPLGVLEGAIADHGDVSGDRAEAREHFLKMAVKWAARPAWLGLL